MKRPLRLASHSLILGSLQLRGASRSLGTGGRLPTGRYTRRGYKSFAYQEILDLIEESKSIDN